MMKELSVDLGERTYPIYIGEGIFDDIADYFARHHISKGSPLLIITDDRVAPLYLKQITRQLISAGYKLECSIVEAGEKSKTLTVMENIITTALQAGLDRNSTIIALGGGVIGDLAGYVAASYMRGVRFVQLPTTIQAHDSSVGGKVGVNHKLAKNIIGAFHQPEFVLYDIASLRTLPEREIRAGLAEVIKHGLIWDAAFVQWWQEHEDLLLALDSEALQYALYVGCHVKSIIVSQDERENGLRAILNLGHTIGHALETVGHYEQLLHGEAIAIGMVGAAMLSLKLGHSVQIYECTKQLFIKLGLPTSIPDHMDVDDILEAMKHDKKFREGKMMFIIPTEIGKVEMNKDIPVEWVREVLQQLKQEG